MQTKSNPTLLEIACAPNHWSAYLAVDGGEFDSHELAVTAPVGKLMQMQECGYSEAHRGDMYDSNGYLNGENVLVEIESSGATGEWPTIVIGDTVHRTQDFREISADTLTGPGGWYVIVRGTEGGEE